ncbi:adenosine receptor A2b-like [Stylophora pistillata]|uniref:adenosine receptor A2b-like n=1 Tax=Stylophora pistillata TaxID=50429 RepID=UPI000C04FEFC|nr:adenosine receptor A2b-like [Stylophora pistillata]
MSDNLALVITFVFLSALIIAVNLTVCVIVYLRKSMRTYTNGFVVSLAFSDLLIGSVLIPAALVSPHSVEMGYLISITLLSGVFNLVSVTFDRYVSVLKALQYENIMRSYFKGILAASWSLAFIVSLIPLIWGTNTTMLAHKVYVLSEIGLCVLLPYVLIFVGYVRIFLQVKRRIERERAITASVRKNLQRRSKISSEGKLAQVFIIVAVMFVISWLPVQYMTVVHELGRPELIPNDLVIVSLFTIVLGSLINPVVYSFLKPDFRKAIRHILNYRRDLRRRRLRGSLSTPASCKSQTTNSSWKSRPSQKNNTTCV